MILEHIAMESSPAQEMTRDNLDTDSPDNIDDKPLARQKRKRTSPEDQIVLEAAYKRDPKPDKAARLELVKRVALSEKEVQIWFQNRRQSSRRKSRPLLPHEIAKYSFARSEALDNGLLPSQAFPASFEVDSSPNTDAPQSSTTQPETSSPSLPFPSETQPDMTEPPSSERPLKDTRETHQITSSPTPSQGRGPSMTSRGVITSETDLLTRAAARLDVPDPDRSPFDRNSGDARTLAENRPLLPLKKASSFVRLVMNADGNAGVTTKDASSPSPPRPSQSSTWSDATTISSFSQKLSRSTSGRSRDSRSWEFWCDKEARSELELKAEKDASGSAAGAIGLLRSASGRSVLSNLPSKRNASFAKQPFSAKRPKLGPDVPSLHRSNTTLGRLQNKTHRSNILSQPRLKHSKSASTTRIPGNDSDKENWSPEREVAAGGQPYDPAGGDDPLAAKAKGQSLLTASLPMSSANRRKASSREQMRGLRKGDTDPEEDAELSAFMRADLHSSSPSVEDDLDCVQGLLSLSQGNWR